MSRQLCPSCAMIMIITTVTVTVDFFFSPLPPIFRARNTRLASGSRRVRQSFTRVHAIAIVRVAFSGTDDSRCIFALEFGGVDDKSVIAMIYSKERHFSSRSSFSLRSVFLTGQFHASFSS